MAQHEARFCTGNWIKVVVAVVFGWSTTVAPALADISASRETARNIQIAQAGDASTAPAPNVAAPVQGPVYSLTDLEFMLAPIALYPDPLLTLIMTASAFPLQVVQADRWIVANPDAVQSSNFAEADAKPWDPSVQALTRFPEVIEMLADHLDWTESLGAAFALQPADVSATIQMLRARAERAGNLKTTPQQRVAAREEGGTRVIYITPANPQRIYVPVYNPTTVFDTALSGALLFSTGVLVGSAWNNRWGWNNRYWNQVWVAPPAWRPPPRWRPYPGRPGARPPGVRPGRPGGVHPDRPGVRPERPDRPGMRPDRPGVRPDRPGVRPDRPDRPAARPDRPAAGPDRPAARPDRPAARPDRPAARPDRPAARPDRPAARPDRPAARPSRPATPPERPAARPGGRPSAGGRPANVQRQQGARPQQRARPQQGARPQQQQRARPQQGGGQRARPAPRSRN